MLTEAVALAVAADDDVRALSAREAVTVMADAVRAHGRGDLSAPPRQSAEVDGGGFVLTAGRLPGVAAGFRVYSALADAPGEATLVFSPDGDRVGVVGGRELGRRRTGALGGVAADLCARSDSHVLGVVGAGEQAFTQLWAVNAVRELRRVRVHTRDPRRAAAFAQRAEEELQVAVEVVGTAQAAVADADIVVLATPAGAPLIQADWLAPGVHVHTLGPKGAAEGECPRSLVRAADVLVSDSPAQLSAMEGADQPWTEGRPAVSLGEISVGAHRGRTGRDDITLYASVGLAGTEVLLAHHLLTNHL